VRTVELILALLLAGCASSPTDAPPPPVEVPIQLMNNVVLVAASVNGGASALLIVDTGASATILTPRLLRRLELAVPADAPRRQLRVVGGEKLDVPFIRVSTIAIGGAMVKDQDVGVYDFAPDTPVLDGLLGGDVLHRFRVTLDRSARRMRLEPLAR
jgi:predicted aspartyl protease